MEPDPIPTPELLNAALDVPLSPPRPKAEPEPKPAPPAAVVDVTPLPRMLTPDDVAAVLQVTSEAVRSWLRSGRLRGAYIGRVWRVRPEDLEAFVQANMAAPPKGEAR